MQNINELLIKDKFAKIEQVADVLKDEILPIAQNFFELSEEPIVRFRREENKYVFNIEIEVSRVKPFGSKF